MSRPGRWRLVEDATVERIAGTGLWLPVLGPEREPALELVLVIDSDPRLRPWRELMQPAATCEVLHNDYGAPSALLS